METKDLAAAMTSKILVFGQGQMAGAILEYFDRAVISSGDITKPNQIKSEIKKYKPGVIINTAAKTSIDWCELNKIEAFGVNTLGALNVWKECQLKNIYLVHFSSGCIYSSKTERDIYKEGDPPAPLSYYSWTKVWAENLLGHSPNLLILRPRMLISNQVDRRNTMAKWLTYSNFVNDQNSMTILEDMLSTSSKMIKHRISGTYHIVNRGTASPLELAKMLKKEIDPQLKIKPTTLKKINQKLVARRCSTILSTGKLSRAGFEMPPLKSSLVKIIVQFKQNLKKAGGLAALQPIKNETAKKFRLKHG